MERRKRALWEFYDGHIVNIDDRTGTTTSASFDRYFYPLSRDPVDLAKLPTDPATMTVGQARRAERLLKEANNLKEARRLRVRIQEKFAFPAICLVFGLIGSSLGVRPHARTSRSQGFGISVLLIFRLLPDVIHFQFHRHHRQPPPLPRRLAPGGDRPGRWALAAAGGKPLKAIRQPDAADWINLDGFR
jgi:hypothetical protein